MAGTNGGSPDAKHRFTPDVVGLTEFIDQFMVIWKLFSGILDVIDGSAKAVEKFEARKQNLVRHATLLIEKGGEKAGFSRTIGFGMHLMHDIEDFLEALIVDQTANPYFDSRIKKIRELSESAWSSKEVAVLETRAKFTDAAQTDDLAGTVGYYAEVLRHLNAVETAARDAANADRRQREEAERRGKADAARARGKNLLAALA